MITIVGILAFGVLFLYDIVSLKKVKYRYIMAVVGYGAQIFAVGAAALGDKELAVGLWVPWAGWFLALAGAGWLLYCLFLFPPMRRSYWQAGGPVLTTEGPYALSRHPGVYGYTAMVIGLALGTRSSLLLESGLVWSLVNLGYVLVQDYYIFPVLLTGYWDYRKETPMIIPNKTSIKRFWDTMNYHADRGNNADKPTEST